MFLLPRGLGVSTLLCTLCTLALQLPASLTASQGQRFRPVTFIALIVALRVTVPPSSGLFQSEPPGQEEWDLTVVVCSWNPPAGV